MARQVDQIPVSSRGSLKYPWHEWLNGDVWELTQGEDFICVTSAIVNTAKAAARARNIPAKIVQRGNHVYVQAILDGQARS